MAKAKEDFVAKMQSLRGMLDLLPQQTLQWQEIEAIALKHFQRACIAEIRTPILEVTELFARGIGESTDVVGKEMYSFIDRGERNCTLRPEGTASVVRAAIQHGLLNEGPQKVWYKGPMFRYERPQAGRQRQFHQIGVEYLGFEDPRSDLEAIAIAWDFLHELGLKELNLEINSLGDSNDRSKYKEALVEWLEKHFKELDPDSQNRIKTNPLRILDSKNSQTQMLLKESPKLTNFLSEDSLKRFLKIQSGLKKLAIPFNINRNLVRGLDYYSHTAFEITSEQLGAQSTICGGGRYNTLVEKLGGPECPAIGWAIGMERLILLLSKIDNNQTEKQTDIYIVNRGLKAEDFAMLITRDLRLKNKIVEIDFSGSAFKKQLKRANKSGARWAIIIGDNEVENRNVVLKDLRGNTTEVSKEEKISIEGLFSKFS